MAMTRSQPSDIDWKSPPFDELTSVQHLARDRRGSSSEHARHQLYTGRDTRSRTSVLIKVTSKPGLVYEQNLVNEIASLSTINQHLPESRHFPFVQGHGRLRDGRVYLITSLFDEFPLAMSIDAERMPNKVVAHLRTAIEVAAALAELHRLPIFHVDLNPMNILHRVERDRPVIRIVDFESSYEVARHAAGEFYNPPTTPRYSAPEVPHQPPDARADVFSLGAVLYTMLTGYGWTWVGEVGACVEQDHGLDAELRDVLLTAVDPDRESRYASVEACRAALAQYLERIWPGRSR